MISTDFAPNESWDDAFLSLKLILQPWRWIHGPQIDEVKNKIQQSLYTAEYKQRHPELVPISKRSSILDEVGISGSINTTLFLTGRAALYYYLKSLNLTAGSDVVIQAFTCEAVALPIITADLNPVYVDIEKETYSMDFEDLKKKITPNTKVIILQHTFGYTPTFRNEILKFAEEKNLYILEDLAHGWNPEIFSAISNKPSAISNKPSAISYLLSFGSSKAFSSVMGGAIVTTDKTVLDKLSTYEKQLANPSILFIFRTLLYKSLSVLIKMTYDIQIGKILHKILNMFHIFIPVITAKEKKGDFDESFAKAYPNALAVLLLYQLNKYPQTLEKRSETIQAYDQHFSPGKTSQPTLSRYPVLVENRDEILQKAAAKNIYLGKWYDQVVAPKEIDLAKMKYTVGTCQNAEEISAKIINLPLNIKYSFLTNLLKLFSDP